MLDLNTGPHPTMLSGNLSVLHNDALVNELMLLFSSNIFLVAGTFAIIIFYWGITPSAVELKNILDFVFHM